MMHQDAMLIRVRGTDAVFMLPYFQVSACIELFKWLLESKSRANQFWFCWDRILSAERVHLHCDAASVMMLLSSSCQDLVYLELLSNHIYSKIHWTDTEMIDSKWYFDVLH
jgi:hypothetical protein